MNSNAVDRRVRFLILSNVASWACLAWLALSSFLASARPQEPASVERLKVTTLEAERIDILGTNGKPVLVLSNRRLMPGPSMNGKDYSPAVADGREYVSGMIFFNEQGDEVGGLIFNGFPKGTGYSSVGHLSFDQWKQNQVLALQYIDSGSSRRAGFNVWDRPTDHGLAEQLDALEAQLAAETPEERERIRGELAAVQARGENGVQRVFVGSRDRSAELELRDTRGRVRARLVVDASDNARLEFLDAEGKVAATYPP